MVDTGLMRKNEFESTYNIFKRKYKLNVRLINSSKLYLKKLKNVSDPERKRKIIGNLFIKIFEKESKKYKKVKNTLRKAHFIQILLRVNHLPEVILLKLNHIIMLVASLKK